MTCVRVAHDVGVCFLQTLAGIALTQIKDLSATNAEEINDWKKDRHDLTEIKKIDLGGSPEIICISHDDSM